MPGHIPIGGPLVGGGPLVWYQIFEYWYWFRKVCVLEGGRGRGGGDKIAGFSILCAVNTRTHPDGGERGFARLVPVH